MFDTAHKQRYYIFKQFGEPGSGDDTWYARFDGNEAAPDWLVEASKPKK
jgi:hypothetical protein